MKSNLRPQRDRYEPAFAALQSNLNKLSVPREIFQELVDRHIPVSFEKGAMLFCEGNTDGMLACLLAGYVKIYCPIGDGNRTLVRLAATSELIGYPDYIDAWGRRARMFEAQAATKCSVALFSRDQISTVLSKLPSEHLVSLLTSLNTFWSENLRFFASLLNLPLQDRLIIVMSDLARRAGVGDSEGLVLMPEVGHEDFAEMIGCSRPMVSRMIAELVEARRLSKRGKQYVLLGDWDVEGKSSNVKITRKSVTGSTDLYGQKQHSTRQIARAAAISS